MNILIHWKEDYSVNIKRIDEQHKKLINMINILYDSIVRNEKDEILDQTISEMIDYAFVHFKTEEKYFTQFGYKDAPSHIAEHQYFLKKAKKLGVRYKTNDSELKHEVLIFLQEWFINHITQSDRKYIECFIKGGLK